jgi:hypothetical protein
VDPHHPAPEDDAHGGGGQGRLAALTDPEPEQHAQERLVRGRQEQRVPEIGELVRGPQQGEGLGRGLAQVEAGVDDDPVRREAGRPRPLRPLEEEGAHRVDHVLVDGVRVGDARAEPDVGGHHGGPVFGRRRQVVGVGEPADVVAHDRAGPVGLAGHRGPPRVDGQGDVEPGGERLDGRHDPIQLLGLAHLGAGPGLDPSHVEHVGAVLDQHPGPADQVVERVGGATVVEGVRGPVEDAHDQGTVLDVERPGAEPQGGGAHGADATGAPSHRGGRPPPATGAAGQNSREARAFR